MLKSAGLFVFGGHSLKELLPQLKQTIDSTKLQLAFHGLKNIALSMSLERIKSDKNSDTAARFSLDYHF